MNFDEAKERFIQSWGALGSSWGVNRTMAQVHALLLVAPEPMSAEEIRQALNISMGNVNMNVRALIDWGLVRKELKPGERKEFFVAEKDVWRVATLVTRERRKREFAPVLETLEMVKDIEGDPEDKELAEFREVTDNLSNFVSQLNSFLEVLVQSDRAWFTNLVLKIIKRIQ